MNTSEIRENARKQASFPVVEPAIVDYQIDHAEFWRVPNTGTMVCCIILKSGFTVIDYASCKDPRNFDEKIAKKLSFSKARDRIFGLEAYSQMRFPEKYEPFLPNIT